MSRELAIQELKKMYLLYGDKSIRRYEFQYFDVDSMGEEFVNLGYIGTMLYGKYVKIESKIMEA